MSLDTDGILALIKETAEAVVRPRWRALTEGQVAEKNPGDYVTIADREAEVILTEALRRAFPGVLVVGEEATAADPSLPDGLADADHAFVIDPVDGTRNFIEGSPDYAVMVGELRSGRISRGWIWQPEHDAAWVAEAGAGLTCNGRMVARPVPDPARLRGETSNRRLRHNRPAGVDLGLTAFSCGIDYPKLCAGGSDFLLHRTMKPWDHIPGCLMVREVGGVARRASGADYEGRSDDGSGGGGALIVAADEATWLFARDCLEQVSRGQ